MSLSHVSTPRITIRGVSVFACAHTGTGKGLVTSIQALLTTALTSSV